MSDRPVQVTAFEAEKAIRHAQETFDVEAVAMLGLKPRLGHSFDNGDLCGALNSNDLMRAKVI